MKSIRMKIEVPFLRRYITEGMVIGLPSELADDLIERGIADAVEVEHAVIEPDEQRMQIRKPRSRR